VAARSLPRERRRCRTRLGEIFAARGGYERGFPDRREQESPSSTPHAVWDSASSTGAPPWRHLHR
jgi:hypothetical protein